MRITIWNEFVHERTQPEAKQVYPEGIHVVLAELCRRRFGSAATIRTATLDQPEHGLSEAVIADTDVMLWWGHAAHDQVADQVVARVHQAVLEGMGLLVLHSGHGSKLFQRLMGTSCMLRWREAGERERLWIVDPAHEIVAGLEGPCFELEPAEMYGEFFDIPQPDELILLSWFAGGEVFRSGCTFRRGKGRIFYFRPGHETYPVYYNQNVAKVITNAIGWAMPTGGEYQRDAIHVPEPRERLS